MTPPDPYLQGAWFQPMHLSIEKIQFQILPFRFNLHRYTTAATADGEEEEAEEAAAEEATVGIVIGTHTAATNPRPITRMKRRRRRRRLSSAAGQRRVGRRASWARAPPSS